MSASTGPVRVLFPFVGGANMGGSHVTALGLIRGLDPARFEPVVLLHDRTGPFAETLREHAIDIETLDNVPLLGAAGGHSDGKTGPLGYVLHTVPALRRKIHELEARIVHTSDGRMHANWALPTKLCGRKLVWHHRQDPGALGVNKIAPILGDRIVSVSQFSKPIRPIRNIDRKFSVVRSPFSFSAQIPDKTRAHQSICEELGVPPNAVLIG
jgi:hypothetical protein